MVSIDIEKEAAPIIDISQRPPVELKESIRKELLIDRSAQNREAIQAKVTALQPLGVLLSLLLLFFLLKWWMKNPKTAKKITSISPKEVSLSKSQALFRALQKKESVTAKLVDHFIVELSRSVRFHFEEKYQVHVISDTTSEFLQELQEHPAIHTKQKELLKKFLDDTDNIKFALYQPSLKECQHLYAIAQEIITGKI